MSSLHADLQALPDNVLLARLRPLPRASAEREAICEIPVTRHAGLVRGCAQRYRGSPEPADPGAGLPATLILASRVFRSRLGGREWACVVVMAAALASMLFALSPSAGQTSGVR